MFISCGIKAPMNAPAAGKNLATPSTTAALLSDFCCAILSFSAAAS